MFEEILHELVGVFLFVHEDQHAALLLEDSQQLQKLEELLVLIHQNLKGAKAESHIMNISIPYSPPKKLMNHEYLKQ